jgi:hypothetical protein
MESRVFISNMFSFLGMGERVVVFPEGAYYKSRTDLGHSGMIGDIHSTVKVAFIPVGVHYSRGNGQRVVRIRFGQAMQVES